MIASLWAGVAQALQTLWGAIVAATASTKRRRLLITGLQGAGKTTLVHLMRNPDLASFPSPAFSPASGTDIRLDVDVGVTSPYSSRYNRNHHSSSNGRSTRTHVRLVLDAIDLGGLRYRHYPGGVRGLWRDSLAAGGVDGVVFVVDAADHERMDEAAALLEDLLRLLREVEDASGELGRNSSAHQGGGSGRVSTPIPVLVLGNKIDSPNAVGELELRRLLGFPASGDETSGEEGEWEGEVSRPVELFMCSVIMGLGYPDGFGWLASHV
ncbi:GTP-binding protein SAR1a [Madurella fahalii]|uniref:GTP-binding protein SAR1a n=1 Tax=Madurella fahalii TaxID=1157608 RepID=A0ABQ0GGN5_9PEZI